MECWEIWQTALYMAHYLQKGEFLTDPCVNTLVNCIFYHEKLWRFSCSEGMFSCCIVTFLHRNFHWYFYTIADFVMMKSNKKNWIFMNYEIQKFKLDTKFLKKWIMGFQGLHIIHYYQKWLTHYHGKVLLTLLIAFKSAL